MAKHKVLRGAERSRLMQALYTKYGLKRSFRQHFVYYRKKYSWLIIVGSAKFLKPLSILFWILLFIIFFPLTLIIALNH